MSTVNTHNMTRLFLISPCLGDTEYNGELLETKLFEYRFCNKPKSWFIASLGLLKKLMIVLVNFSRYHNFIGNPSKYGELQ